MIAAVYARKSNEQYGIADEQKSVARQVDHARSYALRKGWTIADGRRSASRKKPSTLDGGTSIAVSTPTRSACRCGRLARGRMQQQPHVRQMIRQLLVGRLAFTHEGDRRWTFTGRGPFERCCRASWPVSAQSPSHVVSQPCRFRARTSTTRLISPDRPNA